MTKGRKPTPLEVKRLLGNPGKRPLPAPGPRPPTKRPRCPKHLEGEARREYRRLAKLLEGLGLVSELDRAALAAYATAWARWIEAEQALKAEGPVVKAPSGYPVQNPWLPVANRAIAQVVKLLAEFGLTPAARARLGAAAGRPADDLETFLGKADAQ